MPDTYDTITGLGSLAGSATLADTVYNLQKNKKNLSYVDKIREYLQKYPTHSQFDVKAFLTLLDEYSRDAKEMMSSRLLGIPVSAITDRVPISAIIDSNTSDADKANMLLGRLDKIEAKKLWKIKDQMAHYRGAKDSPRKLFSREILTNLAREDVPPSAQARAVMPDSMARAIMNADESVSMLDRFKPYIDKLDNLNRKLEYKDLAPFLIREQALVRGGEHAYADMRDPKNLEKALSKGVAGYGSRVKKLIRYGSPILGLGSLGLGALGITKLLKKKEPESVLDKIIGTFKSAGAINVGAEAARLFGNNLDIYSKMAERIIEKPKTILRLTPKARENLYRSLITDQSVWLRSIGNSLLESLKAEPSTKDLVKTWSALQFLDLINKTHGADAKNLRIGITGPYGSGKSTLSAALSTMFKHHDLDPSLEGGSIMPAINKWFKDPNSYKGQILDHTTLLHSLSPEKFDYVIVPRYTKEGLLENIKKRRAQQEAAGLSKDIVNKGNNIYDMIDTDALMKSFDTIRSDMHPVLSTDTYEVFSPRKLNSVNDRAFDIARRTLGDHVTEPTKNPMKYYFKKSNV